eukprot:TRINITY_DN1834_c0_g1_i1.p2 TRINITY_DN1834_c0_g1~~TRINITY_DN1834_c0_g1_i1.p2  ORF type:complete len:105 (+),score=11.58 TRINITY_DN1834_c0_g1_i1:198-512(+)
MATTWPPHGHHMATTWPPCTQQRMMDDVLIAPLPAKHTAHVPMHGLRAGAIIYHLDLRLRTVVNPSSPPPSPPPPPLPASSRDGPEPALPPPRPHLLAPPVRPE